jgi:CDGSH-type Zn-finger protein/uncharacterized Fe-S cluster protein YjdI
MRLRGKETSMAGIEEVRGQKIVIRFDGARCIHSRNCVLGRPDVFVPNASGAWIHPDRALPEEIAALAASCPSGAITYERLDGGPGEQPPKVNVLRVRENGPLALHAPLRFEGEDVGLRVTLCRCGASKRKPFCDGSHVAAQFAATGEPPTRESAPLAQRDGPVELTAIPNGPLKLIGPLEIVSGTGRTAERCTEAFLCRCGASAHKPYCDGSHKKVGFKSE